MTRVIIQGGGTANHEMSENVSSNDTSRMRVRSARAALPIAIQRISTTRGDRVDGYTVRFVGDRGSTHAMHIADTEGNLLAKIRVGQNVSGGDIERAVQYATRTLHQLGRISMAEARAIRKEIDHAPSDVLRRMALDQWADHSANRHDRTFKGLIRTWLIDPIRRRITKG